MRTDGLSPPRRIADLDGVRKDLLATLAASLDAPRLAYAVRPHRLGGGGGAVTLAFRLDGAPADWSGELVFKGLADSEPHEEIEIESIAQGVVVALGFPAPRVLLVGGRDNPLGRPFMVMQRAPGANFNQQLIEVLRNQGWWGLLRLAPTARRTLPARMAQCAAALHALDPGRLVEALAARGIAAEVVGYRERLARLRDRAARLSHEVSHVLDWLALNEPREPWAWHICHGDLFPGNVMFEGEQVTAVIDWGKVTLAPVEFDIAVLRSLPLPLVPLRPRWLLYRAQRNFVREFETHYRAYRLIDDGRVRFCDVAHTLRLVVEILERRVDRELAGARRPHGLDNPVSLGRLQARLVELCRVQLACLDPGTASRPDPGSGCGVAPVADDDAVRR